MMSASNAEQPELTARRRALAWLAGGALGLTALATARAGVRFMAPPLTTQPPAPVAVSAADIPALHGGRYIPPARAYLMRDERGYYAVSATCTHLGCLVEQGAAGLRCPCHGSQYDRTGAVATGPATRPLPHFAVAWGENGDIVIDPNHAVEPSVRLSA